MAALTPRNKVVVIRSNISKHYNITLTTPSIALKNKNNKNEDRKLTF